MTNIAESPPAGARAGRRRRTDVSGARRRCTRWLGSSLQVADGELVAIVGPSGSGKSTLLNVIGTLDRPTAGTMLVAAPDVTAMSDGALAGLRAARLGFVFQQFHLLEGADAVDNVAAGLVYRGRPRRRTRGSAPSRSTEVGLVAPAQPPTAAAVGRRAPAGGDRPGDRR